MSVRLLCVVLAFMCSPVSAENWSPRSDKVKHFAVGTVISSVNPIMRSSGTDHDCVLAPMVTSLALAAGNEYIDSRQRGNYWSWADFAYTIAGTAVGVTMWQHFKVVPIKDGLAIAGRY